MEVSVEYYEFNKDLLYFYSPYNILRNIPKQIILDKEIYPIFLNENSDYEIINVVIQKYNHYFYVKYLDWDSNFNGFKTYKLIFCLYKHRNFLILNKAIEKFMKSFFLEECYLFIDVPSEDIFFIQALNYNRFKLVETRLNHYIENLEDYKFERFPVRLANNVDIPSLKEVASNTINSYDRLHADEVISQELADRYLATYIENALNGFSDAVIVPDLKNEKVKGFMVLNLLKKDSTKLGRKIGRLQLSAIDSSLKGWYIKLASEAIYYAKTKGVKSMLVTTQSTNRAAFHSSEKQGFKLGSVTHVLTYSNLKF